ncbi:hypothetical protein OJAV_G00026970, partial [Oryzias javanicus]
GESEVSYLPLSFRSKQKVSRQDPSEQNRWRFRPWGLAFRDKVFVGSALPPLCVSLSSSLAGADLCLFSLSMSKRGAGTTPDQNHNSTRSEIHPRFLCFLSADGSCSPVGGRSPVSMASLESGLGASSLWSGLVPAFILLLLLAIFLTALCSDCNRRSFELKDPEAAKSPSALIRVVRIEEVQENPMIQEIQKDEREFHPKEETPGSPSHIQQGEPKTDEDSLPEGTPVSFIPWRSHLMAPESKDLNGSAPSDSAHLFNPLERGRSNNNNEPSPSAGDGLPGDSAPRSAVTLHFSGPDRNSVYARVSKKLRLTDSPVHSPEEKKEEPEEEEVPPLPDRKPEMDG